MSPKVKTVKSSEKTARNELNKSSIQISNNNKKIRSDWTESDEPPCFSDTINTRGLRLDGKKSSVKIKSPSKSGSTRCFDSSKAKYTARFYRRRLKQCKRLIKILISAKRENPVKKYIKKSVWILDDSHERNSRVKEENPRAPRIDVIDLTSDRDNNARKSGELSNPGKKIPEGRSVPSTSKQFDASDDESSIRSMNSQREYSDQKNMKRENLSDSSDNTTIISREQSKKQSEGLRSKETKLASNSFFANDEIGCPTITPGQKNVQKSNSRVKDSEDQPKGQGSNSAISSSKSTGMSKTTQKTATQPESKNFNPSVDKKSKPATTGIGCLCKIKKLKSPPALSYKVPSDTKNPGSKFCNHERRKSGQDVEIHEKKATKSYSPLELRYREGSVQTSRPDGSKNLAKENEDVSKPSHQVNKNSASHERGSKNSEGTVACSELIRQNLSKQPSFATFSKYSIPVSIEIHMVPDNMKARIFSGNLKQSKLTNYYPIGRAQDRRLQRKNVDSNSVGDGGRKNRDENGNKVEPAIRVVAGRQNLKPRSLPVVRSDVLLQNRAEISFADKYPLQKPKLSMSSQEYWYNLRSYPAEQAQSAVNQPGNQNIIFCNNVTLSQKYNVTNEPVDYHLTNPYTTDDSNCSIVPPSYSVSSDDVYDDPHAIGADLSLDTDQLEEMLVPWDKVNNFEKVNRWNAGNKC